MLKVWEQTQTEPGVWGSGGVWVLEEEGSALQGFGTRELLLPSAIYYLSSLSMSDEADWSIFLVLQLTHLQLLDSSLCSLIP